MSEITIDIIEQADTVNAIKRGYTIELIKNGWMALSKPSKEQVEGEAEGGYFEHGAPR